MNVRLFWRGVFILLFVFVTWLTLTPNPDETKPSLAIARFIAQLIFHDQSLGDKVAHFLAYSALGGSAALSGFAIGGRRAALIAALAVYGALLEYVQGLGGVRSPELADAVANSLGALFSFPVALFFERLAARTPST
ncbi:MAG: VanZ family protein [Parvularculaceae bacterium]|nr:VanZ family protein [Parvularculaceae bacterium]